MALDRISLAADADVGRRIREAAAKEGVSISTWLGAAAEAKLRNEALAEAIAAYAAEHGAFTETEMAEAEAWLAEMESRSLRARAAAQPDQRRSAGD